MEGHGQQQGMLKPGHGRWQPAGMHGHWSSAWLSELTRRRPPGSGSWTTGRPVQTAPAGPTRWPPHVLPPAQTCREWPARLSAAAQDEVGPHMSCGCTSCLHNSAMGPRWLQQHRTGYQQEHWPPNTSAFSTLSPSGTCRRRNTNLPAAPGTSISCSAGGDRQDVCFQTQRQVAMFPRMN